MPFEHLVDVGFVIILAMVFTRVHVIEQVGANVWNGEGEGHGRENDASCAPMRRYGDSMRARDDDKRMHRCRRGLCARLVGQGKGNGQAN